MSSVAVKVAVCAPSADLAARCPWMLQQGCERLRTALLDTDCSGAEVVVLPTATQTGSTPEQRAAELNMAFADPNIRAIFCTIGGTDCIRILPFLDSEIIRKNADTLFFGYSDITHIHVYLWNLGVKSYYGCAVLCQFGISGPDMQPVTKQAVRDCFQRTRSRVYDESSAPGESYIPNYHNWFGDREVCLKAEPDRIPAPGWIFANCPPELSSVTGVLFGGCVEVLFTSLAAGVLDEQAIAGVEGIVLLLETSEEMPADNIVHKLTLAVGARGWLKEKVVAILMGIPATRFLGKVAEPSEEEYMLRQREALLLGLEEYGAKNRIPILFNFAVGHTDPQVVVPLGRRCTIDVRSRTVEFDYAS